MLNFTKKIATLTLIGAAVVSAGCATKVTRVDPSEEIALSDQWNAKDSELVATEMISDMLSFPWVTEFEMDNNRRPTVIIQRINNKDRKSVV